MNRRLKSPTQVELALTADCNLRCRYCHFFGSPNEVKRELSTAGWLQIIDELGAMQVLKVVLTGGEVLLRPDLQELIEAVVRNRMRFRLLSNGALLTDGMAAFFAATGRCDGVQISLDGLRDAHDFARGAGSFDLAVQALQLLEKHRLPFSVRITVGRHNLGTLGETVDFLIRLGVRRISSNLVVDFAGSAPSGMMLDKREQLQAALEHKAVAAAHPDVFSLAGSVFGIMLNKWPEMLARQRAGAPPDCRRKTACPAPATRMTIRADGGVIPCNHVPDVLLGFAGRDSLREIWADSPRFRQFRADMLHPVTEYRRCAGCSLADYCDPECPGINPDGIDGCAAGICLREYMADVPDFDFEKMEWRS